MMSAGRNWTRWFSLEAKFHRFLDVVRSRRPLLACAPLTHFCTVSLTSTDLKVAELRAPVSTLNGLARPSRAGVPVGRSLQTPLRANAMVGLDGLGPTAPAGREITIPVTPDHALGGAVRTGDRVDVLATFDKGTDAARTLTVARAATVRGVVQSDGLFGQRAGAISALTLNVVPDAAIVVAFAARNAELDIVRSIGTGGRRGRSRYDAGDVR